MRNTAIIWVLITTAVLVVLAIMLALGSSFNWIFYVTAIGQTMCIYMVYKVLTDPYSTTKTFDDFYGDHPIDREK